MVKPPTKIIVIVLILLSCNNTGVNKQIFKNATVKPGLDVLMEEHLSELNGIRIALVTNKTAVNINNRLITDIFFENKDIGLVKIFTPEHGFSGNFVAGETITNDTVTSNLPQVISLYGKARKPTQDMLKDIDLIIYDIQDVGARFYTYISTLGLVMEAAAEADIPIMVLDRPNPIGFMTEGPVLVKGYSSFIGKYPIPVRYGMTIGELAKMIVGEKMISPVPELAVIPMKNYNYSMAYEDTKLKWINPSPNIPDLETSIIYPGICLFEATNISEGRGTLSPFKQIGAPWIDSKRLCKILNDQYLPGVTFIPSEFTPKAIPGMSANPKYENEKCNGIIITINDFESYESVLTGVTVLYFINKMYPDSLKINSDYLAKLWGSNLLEEQILAGYTPQEIVKSYQVELNEFHRIKRRYLLYN